MSEFFNTAYNDNILKKNLRRCEQEKGIGILIKKPWDMTDRLPSMKWASIKNRIHSDGERYNEDLGFFSQLQAQIEGNLF